MGFRALGVDDFYDDDDDESLIDNELDFGIQDQKVPDVTWKQRVYLLWLTLIELQASIETHNRATIGAIIDQRLRAASVSGHRYRKIEAYQRVRECMAMTRNILRRNEDEDA